MPASNSLHHSPTLLWDVFCRVIDNHGDLGVLLRLSRQLGSMGHQVRLWVDDASALRWMAPEPIPNLHVIPWEHCEQEERLKHLPMADVWVEGFGCEIPTFFIANFATNISLKPINNIKKPVWINLEYLTAEPYAERCHGLPSPIMNGPAQGWTKHFYYPGFSRQTGGLLRETQWLAERAGLDRAAWLQTQGVDWRGERLVSLFCYEPPALASWLRACAEGATPTRLLVAHGRPAAAVRAVWPTAPCSSLQPNLAAPYLPEHQWGSLTMQWLPPMSQPDFDRLLWACDWNFVRGEDSLVRAIWAGRPFVWHIYPQEDGAHHAKLHAFLERLNAPPSVWQWHQWWNQDVHQNMACAAPEGLTTHWLPAHDQAWFEDNRHTLALQTDLATQLLDFVRSHTPTVQCAVTFQPPGV